MLKQLARSEVLVSFVRNPDSCNRTLKQSVSCCRLIMQQFRHLYVKTGEIAFRRFDGEGSSGPTGSSRILSGGRPQSGDRAARAPRRASTGSKMKFGKILRATVDARLPQWSEYMVDYKLLKQAINREAEAQGARVIKINSLCSSTLYAARPRRSASTDRHRRRTRTQVHGRRRRWLPASPHCWTPMSRRPIPSTWIASRTP